MIRRAETILFSLLLTACASAPQAPVASSARDTHERLHGALWYQTTPEFWVTSTVAFASARRQLDIALLDKTWTAALEQEGMDVSALPPAVVLDIDETVLNNSPFQARLAHNRIDYSQPLFDCWVDQEAAEAMPGAKQFLDYATTSGVDIIYITNRTADQEKATVRNLTAASLPVSNAGDSVLSKGEVPSWSSEKKTRREEVAKSHRILLLVGDDLGDFTPGSKASPSDRRKLAESAATYWGTKWILLPNPLYGSWEQALYNFDFSLTDPQILAKKFNLLKPFDSSKCPGK